MRVPHVPDIRNRGAHPMIHGLFSLKVQLAWACLATAEVWQHLLAEMPQHARLLGVHDVREASSASKIWTLLTAIRKKINNREESVDVYRQCLHYVLKMTDFTDSNLYPLSNHVISFKFSSTHVHHKIGLFLTSPKKE